jgi:xanthine dehydrogenase accessory factor
LDDAFVECLWPPDGVILFGLGHVTRAIGPALAAVGFEVVICDDNETGALDRDSAWAVDHAHSFELSDVERQLGSLGAGDFVIITTRDHADDQRILEQALRHPNLERWSYLGLIGSRGKIGRFRKRLVAKGLDDAAAWARLSAPIGVDIGAETPAEIAVAVAAELIALRSRFRMGAA